MKVIEAARVRETVGPEYSVSGSKEPGRLPVGRRIHEGMDRGAAAYEKNGATTSQNMTAITNLHNRFLKANSNQQQKPRQAGT